MNQGGSQFFRINCTAMTMVVYPIFNFFICWCICSFWGIWASLTLSYSDDDFTLLDDDDISSLLKKALNAMVFSFLRCSVVRSPGFRNDAAAFETLDTLVKLFITYFPDKVSLTLCAISWDFSCSSWIRWSGIKSRIGMHMESEIGLSISAGNFSEAERELLFGRKSDRKWMHIWAAFFGFLSEECLKAFQKI